MTTAELIGNGISLIAMVVMFISALRRDKRKILIDQTINYGLFFAADIVLRGYSGAVQDALSGLRHILVLRGKQSRALNAAFIAAFVTIGLLVNDKGIVGLLPIVASVEYTLVVMRPNVSTTAIKLSMAFCMLLWAIYAFTLHNYVNVVSNTITMISSLYALCMDRRRQNKEASP